MTSSPPGAWLLAIDTATSTVVVAAGTPAGKAIAVRTFEAGHRHSEHLLPTLERVAADSGLQRRELSGVIVGTGPGAFTGLRVGLATAKTLAHELSVPLVGVSTAEALLAAASPSGGSGGSPTPLRLWLPAGPHERLVVDPGRAPVRESDLEADDVARTEIAVDLPSRASEEALARGREALRGLPEALLRLGAARLGRGETADPARLVPEYVTPPRGMAARTNVERGLAWSRGPR
jgi:tRNA threonylcarbamoyl adenosine modification protein YeaZ